MLLVTFMVTTVIMPYSNYEDAKSLISLYKSNLDTDQDMNFAEFIGEKLIASGLEFDDEEDVPMQSNKIPRTHDEVIQIQNGVLFHKQEVLIEFAAYIILVKIGPDYITKINNEDFCPGIFRPPIV